ncbi:helix-turn-helix domain-containing protein [Streptomyces sp. NBC_01506]|uniref:helix-turn-helix domain-containing protein n=1 Tax=Streptomyces sp. NBC_01506 TaxID=2903887 RepID=UPI003868E21A
MPTDTESPYMTTKEVAALIRKTPHAVRQMRHRGLAPKGMRVGRSVLYHRDAVAAWLTKRTAGDALAQRAA